MKIYTDGSFNRKLSKNTTAYAAVVIVEEDASSYVVDIVYGISTDKMYVDMWNVGGEILAVISGIDYALLRYSPKDIQIYHDYIGLREWAIGKWKANKMATQSYANYVKSKIDDAQITFIKVTGHSNNQLNDLADEYANKATENYLKSGKEVSLISGLRVSKK